MKKWIPSLLIFFMAISPVYVEETIFTPLMQIYSTFLDIVSAPDGLLCRVGKADGVTLAARLDGRLKSRNILPVKSREAEALPITGGGALLNVNVAMIGDYPSFESAVDTIGPTPTVLIIDRETTVSGDKTVPPTLGVWILGAGNFKLGGYNLQFSGKVVAQSDTVDFVGPGMVTFSGSFDSPVGKRVFSNLRSADILFKSIGALYPEMWGAVGDDIANDAAAVNDALAKGGTLKFLPGKIYKIAATNLALASNSDIYLPVGSTIHLAGTRILGLDTNNVRIWGGGKILSTDVNTTDPFPRNWQLLGILSVGSTKTAPVNGIDIDGIELCADWVGPHTYPAYGPAKNKSIEVGGVNEANRMKGILIMNAKNVKVRNCTIHHLVGEAIINNQAGGKISFPSDNTGHVYSNNVIYDCNHDAISGQQNIIEDAVYSGNVIKNCLQGIEVLAGLITGNSILDPYIAGITNGGNYIGKVSVKGNLVKNSAGYGIVMEDANPTPYSSIDLIGNTVIGTALDGIAIGNGKNIAVHANYLSKIGTITGWQKSAGAAAVKAYQSIGSLSGNTMIGEQVKDINGLYIGRSSPNLRVGHNVILNYLYPYADKNGVTITNAIIEFYHDQLPTYTDNAAAKAAGLTRGRLYKTSAGAVMVVY
jgi:hypothetical protein